jgi:hypothetical protein
MRISLRKAAALQKEILAAAPAVSALVKLSVYSEDPVLDLLNHERKVLEAVALRANLMKVLSEIRKDTAKVNMDGGIQGLVSRAAFIDKDIAFLSTLASADARPSSAVVSGKIDRLRTTDTYGYSEEVVLSTLSAESIENFAASLATLKKEKVKIQDELLELNIKNSIKLSEESVSVLTEAGLL